MRLTRRSFLSCASCAVLGSGLLGCAGSRQRAGNALPINTLRKPIRPPRGQVLFIAGQGGDHIGEYLDHMPVRPGGFTVYCSVASGWGIGDPVCDRPELKDSVLHLSVGWVDDSPLSPGSNNRAITTGAFDANIERLAQWCAGQPRPILLRIGYEFDRGVPIPHYHYDPAYFAHGFRRMVDRIRAAGARNVATVLASTNCPGFSPVLTTKKFNRFYPGDEYVDWLGCSMWMPQDVDQVILSEARKRGKPVLLAETTPVKYNIGQGTYWPHYIGLSHRVSAQEIWDGWHQPMIDFLQANSDVIAAWHYIAEDWSADAQWGGVFFFSHCDARPWANPEFAELWNRQINAAPFMQASPTLFHELGYS